MMKIDAHQHFWRYEPSGFPWIKPGWPIRKDFLPDDLEPWLKKAGLKGCIAVQARQSLAENQFLLELADQSPLVLGVVGWVDLRSVRVGTQLTKFAAHPKAVGVRHVVQDEPDSQFLMQPDFVRGIGRLKKFDLAYDLLVFPHQLPAAVRLAEKFPEQRFVLDHLAKPRIRERHMGSWKAEIHALARHPQVMCKVSGMVTEADWKNWKLSDFRPYWETVLEAFGPSRLMYGSDWPVCLLAGKYPDIFELAEELSASLSEKEKKGFFGENAARFYLSRNKKLE